MLLFRNDFLKTRLPHGKILIYCGAPPLQRRASFRARKGLCSN